MAPPTLTPNIPGTDLIKENTETLVNLEANDLTSHLAAPFVLLQDELLVNLGEENKLLLAIARADALARWIDAQIDACVDSIKHGILAFSGGDTSSTEYLHYFGKYQPHQVKAPLLGDELTIVATWLPSLKTSPHVVLNEVGVKLEPLITAGVAAMKAMADTKQALVDFYQVGLRFLLVQKMNSARKGAHGAVGQIVHDHPELKLPTTLPDTFFLHDTRKRIKETPASLDAEIEVLKQRIEALQIKRDKLMEILAAQDRADTKKRRNQRKSDIAKAEKVAAEALAKLTALKKEEEEEDGAEEPEGEPK